MAMLMRTAGLVNAPTCGAPKRAALPLRLIAARDGPRMVQGREHCLEDNTMSGPGDSSQMYAGQNPKSEEMKSKMRQQHTSLGGDGNSAILARRPVVAAVTTVEAPPAASTSTPTAGKSKWVIDESENLKSTMEHRFWTLGPMAIMAATFCHGILQTQGLADAATFGASVLAAYVLSDLGTGIYHWSVDNYGDGQTPYVGKQIAAFQGHHQRPWTITKREFCNNVHLVFKPAAFPAALFLALSPFTPVWCDAFFSSFIFFVCMSQQFHAWSHMKKSELPDFVLQLQDANILISRKAHGAHHRAPFEGNYCIVSGWWNGPLDNSGFFRWLEKVVLSRTGVEPRCWHEPEYEIEEETLSAGMAGSI